MAKRGPPQCTKTAIDIAADLSEPVLDSVLAGFIKEVAFFGTVIKLAELARDVTNQLFLTKVQRFLRGLEEVGTTESEALARQIELDPVEAARAGEAVLLSLHVANEFEKAKILAYIYAAFLRSEIHLDTLKRLNNAVNLAVVDDLWALADQEPENGWDGDGHGHRYLALQALRTTGLAALSDSAFTFTGRRSFIGTEVTTLGEILIEILRSTPSFRARL